MSFSKKLCRLVNTLRYVRPVQVLYRGRYSLPRRPVRPPEEKFSSNVMSLWHAPLIAPESIDDSRNATFLNLTRTITPSTDWCDPAHELLWGYNLHYLDVLQSAQSRARRAFLQEWILEWVRSNPDTRTYAWDPYPLSLRMVNLVKWFARFPDNVTDMLLQNLALQVRVLSQRLEYHLLANHLFANAKALVFAGAYLKGAEAERWLQKGLSLLAREIPEQFLADGGHFERSPMYHASLLWDLCDLVNLAERSNSEALKAVLPAWRAQVSSSAGWLKAMLHPDGEISFFNDASFGIAPSWENICAYLRQLEIAVPEPESPLCWLKDSGYCVLTPEAGSKAILDIAPIGPDYQPGHAHADTLSFELSLFGARFIVNSGTSEYGSGAIRQAERATAAHNTVSVNGENSSEVWAGFRVARRAYPVDCRVQQNGDILKVTAAHNGYLRLKGRNIHRRFWRALSGALFIEDTVEGVYESAIARMHFHPQVTVSQTGALQFECREASGRTVNITLEGEAEASLVSAHWSPEFGVRVPNTCLEVKFSGGRLSTRIQWGIQPSGSLEPGYKPFSN
ncbi:Heparin-sulfate lyase precursor [Legionella geestiana]|uniref:Heparin-sulfate lyase n=1 Tax=Legionella geestiana TaxID=45065 RepID=A0A0W0U9P8_9GAMM|nr:heparinase II/III family protein [Legionella geestiana]KTD04506.1 Heparin-sulfate lyase precursor [Legionella geestiana]QBS12275.1 alginate lyase family protein [Legionella geestiana]STX52990.1 Uncharacterized protein conserved in bacteria [Legionella geestiana]